MNKIQNYYLFFFYIVILITINTLIYNNFFKFYILTSANFSDLQWSPSALFIQNIDVYKSYYDNTLRDIIHKSGYPNYSTVSIYLHLFLSNMSFKTATLAWFILFNLIMIFLYLILKQKVLLNDKEIFLLLSIFLLSKPYMHLLCKGQFSIVSLLAFFLYFFYKNKNSFIGFFLISVKYSFFPIILFYDLISKKRKKYFIYTILLTLILVGHYSYTFNGNFFDNLIAPLLIGKFTTASGELDLQTLFGNQPKNDFLRYTILLVLGIIIFHVIHKKTQRNIKFDLSICSILTLLIFKHLYYDFVLLLPVLIYANTINKNFLKYLAISIIIYFWFFYLNSFTIELINSKIFKFINFIILTSLLIVVVISNLKKDKIFYFK